jgi:hypothetical protein
MPSPRQSWAAAVVAAVAALDELIAPRATHVLTEEVLANGAETGAGAAAMAAPHTSKQE